MNDKSDLIIENYIESMNDFMDSLRDKYKDLGLSDSQIVQAYCSGLTPEQIKHLDEVLKQVGKSFKEMFDNILQALSKFFNNKEFLSMLDKYTQSDYKQNRTKPWEKKRFYDK